MTRHADAKHVEVRLETPPGALVLEVEDDGRGISPEEARGRKSLGLLGIRERALRLGGSVSVTAASPHGTLVSLKVPARRGDHGARSGWTGGKMIKVLIADDHAVVRRGLRQILTEDPEIFVGAEACRTAAEVRELVRAQRWDVVVLDVNMPGGNGIELVSELRRKRSPRCAS